MKTLTLLFAATALSLVAPVARAAAPDVSYQVRGSSASGNAYAYDECTSVGVDVGGSANTVHNAGGPPVQENGTWAGFYSYDWCTGEQSYGWGYVSGGFDGNMNSATIDISFEVYTYSWIVEPDGSWSYVDGGTRTVEIAADLNAQGDAYRGMNHSTSRWGDSFSRSRWIGQWRDAAVTMNVAIDGEIVEVAGSYGSLGTANSGETAIYAW